MAFSYSDEQHKAINEIRKAFDSLSRREDVDYRHHDQHESLNLDQLLDLWKYRVHVFASNQRNLQAPPGNLSAIIGNLEKVKESLEALLSDIPSDQSARDYLDNNLRKINGELLTRLTDRRQQHPTGSLNDEFNDLYWKYVPDKFSVKKIVKETRVERLDATLTGGADLKEAYFKSEKVAIKSMRRMRTACFTGIALLVVIACTGALVFSDPLPFQTTLPINLLIILYCSVEIRRYLIDARNRDLCRIRLRDYNTLPDLPSQDKPSYDEIVKSWYHAFNKQNDKDLSWTDILKPMINRFLNPTT